MTASLMIHLILRHPAMRVQVGSAVVSVRARRGENTGSLSKVSRYRHGRCEVASSPSSYKTDGLVPWCIMCDQCQCQVGMRACRHRL